MMGRAVGFKSGCLGVLRVLSIVAGMVAGLGQVEAAVEPQAAAATALIGVLSLDASASDEVINDTAIYTLFTEQEATEGPKASEAALRITNEALRIVKLDAASPVKARLGAVSTYPAYTPQGKVSGWRARSEIVLESSDFKTLSTVVGKLGNKLQVASVNFMLSRAARQQTEKSLIQQAIEAFQQKADIATKALGYSTYSIRELSLGTPGNNNPRPPVAYMAKPAMREGAAAADSAAPVEGGQSTVTVNLSGAVQMR